MSDTQTSFDEKLDEIIAAIAGDTYDYASDLDSDRDEAVYSATKQYKAAIKQLILSDVIGEDENYRKKTYFLVQDESPLIRNDMRSEQRLIVKGEK